MKGLFIPCVENAIVRDGYKPFKRTIDDALTTRAVQSTENAFVKDELHRLRTKFLGRRGA